MGSPAESPTWRPPILLSLILVILLLNDTTRANHHHHHRHHHPNHHHHHNHNIRRPIHGANMIWPTSGGQSLADIPLDINGSTSSQKESQPIIDQDWPNLCPRHCLNARRLESNSIQLTSLNSASQSGAHIAKICGSNGRFYSSHCHMRRASCKIDRIIVPVDPSYCKQAQVAKKRATNGAMPQHQKTASTTELEIHDEIDDSDGDQIRDQDIDDIVSDIEIDQDDQYEDHNDATQLVGDKIMPSISYEDANFKAFKEKLQLNATKKHQLPVPRCTRDLYRQMLAMIWAKFDGDSGKIFSHFDKNRDSTITANELWLDVEDSKSLFTNDQQREPTTTTTTLNYILEPISDENSCSLSHLMLYEDQNHDDIIQQEELNEAFKRQALANESNTTNDTDNNDPIMHWQVNLGDSLELQCKLNSASEINEIEWLRNGIQLRQMLNLQQSIQDNTNDQIRVTNDFRLQLRDIQLYMAGNYTCRRHADQLHRQQQHHQLQVSVPARVTVWPAFQWAPIGSQAQLECQYEYLPPLLTASASGSGAPKVKWFKNGQELKDVSNSMRVLSDEISLNNQNITSQETPPSSDDGFYEYDSQSLRAQTRESTREDSSIDDDISLPGELQYAKASISMSSSKLTINPLAPDDTGSISCHVSLDDDNLNGTKTSSIGSDYGLLLVQDDPARVVNDDLDSGREHLWLFHDNGITIYSLSMAGPDDQIQLVRDFTGHATIPPQIDNNWNQLTLCGGLNPDEAVICEWSDNAIIMRPQFGAPIRNQRRHHHRKQQVGYVYVSQPNLNRILVFDSQQFEIVSILNTDPQPKQLWLYNSYPIHQVASASSSSLSGYLKPIKSPMEIHRRNKELQRGGDGSSMIFRTQQHSDIWILCHGQPLVVDTATTITTNNENNGLNGLDGSKSDFTILNDITDQLIPIKYRNNKQTDVVADLNKQNNNWQQQISSKEQRLRNRRSVQIIRTTSRLHTSPPDQMRHTVTYNNEQDQHQMIVSDSLKRFKSTTSIASYHLKSNPFGLIHDLYMPHIATPLQDNYRHHVQYAYVSHYDERKLVRINMDKMASDNIIELGDCVPIYQLTTATGLLIIQCRTPITHQLKGQLILDQLTNSFISYYPDIQAQRSFLSPDHRYLISIYTVYNSNNNQQQQQQVSAKPPMKLAPKISTNTTTATTNNNTGRKFASAKIIVQKITPMGLEFQYDVKTSLYIIDCAFVWKNGDYDAILVSGLGQQDEILSLRLMDGRVELISGILGRIANQHSGIKVSDRSKLAAIATDKGVYVLDMEDSRVKCQVPKHHQFTTATLLWV